MRTPPPKFGAALLGFLVALLIVAGLWLGLAIPLAVALAWVVRPLLPSDAVLTQQGFTLALTDVATLRTFQVGLSAQVAPVLSLALLSATTWLPLRRRLFTGALLLLLTLVGQALLLLLVAFALPNHSRQLDLLYGLYWAILPGLFALTWCYYYWLPLFKPASSQALTTAPAAAQAHTGRPNSAARAPAPPRKTPRSRSTPNAPPRRRR